MKDLNVTIMEGRTTRLPELKYTRSGTPLLAFSVAVNYSVKEGDEYKEIASFFDCEYFGKGAESVSRFIGKATKVLIQGEFRQDRWDQDGQPRSKAKIFVQELKVLDFHRDKPEGEKPSVLQGVLKTAQQKTFAETVHQKAPAPAGDIFEDDIPF
jgi:single-strand DNA-binding protein